MEQTWPSMKEIAKLDQEGLLDLLAQKPPRSVWAKTCHCLGIEYSNSREYDKMLPVIDEMEAYSTKYKDQVAIALTKHLRALYYTQKNQLVEALALLKDSLKLSIEHNEPTIEVVALAGMAGVFSKLGMDAKGLEFQLQVYEKTKEQNRLTSSDPFNIGYFYICLKQYSEAIAYLHESLDMFTENDAISVKAMIMSGLVVCHIELDELDKAQQFLDQLLTLSVVTEGSYFYHHHQVASCLLLYKQQQWAQCLDIGKKALLFFEKHNSTNILQELYAKLMECASKLELYEQAYTYAKLCIAMKNEEERKNTMNHALQLQFQLGVEREEKEYEKRLGEVRLKTMAMLAGEMAHEIQNPLQFVNNFSQMNLELLDDLDADPNDADARLDLRENCEKINEHGKRISKIVAELQDKTNKAQAGELELPTEDVHDFGKQLR